LTDLSSRPRSRAKCALVGLLALAACEPQPEVIAYDWQLPEGVEPPSTPADNPQTIEKVELGRHLFYELRLSKNENRACGTCHEQQKGFTDGFHRAVGTDNDLHGHNTLTLTNAGYRSVLNWTYPDPRALEQQLLVPLLGVDPIEMGMGGREAQLLAWLADDPVYAELFASAFPDEPEPVTLDNLARSISAFERTLISVDAPLDRYLRGDEDAISPAAKRGWELFRSPEVGCSRCHGGRDFASPTDAAGNVIDETSYHNVGLYDVDGNGSYPESAQGLFAASGEATDMGKFRTPTLRNLAYTGPYMHDGSVISLVDAIDILAAGGRNVQSGPFAGDGRANPYKDPAIRALDLNDEQRADLLELLLALGDENFVTDPRLASPFVE
jgi:cytochrome c peroxidase